MGIGTVTLRFMMDDLREINNGFPNAQDVENLQTFLDTLRPVTALDLFVVAPVPFPISFTLNNLINADSGTLQNIQNSVQAMLLARRLQRKLSMACLWAPRRYSRPGYRFQFPVLLELLASILS